LASSAATVGTKDVSNLSTITLIWPGGSSYKSPGNYTLQDQQFRISGGAYTQDDGTLRVSFAVPQLLNMEDSNLWGNKSPYVTTPDPGLLLPWRVTWYNNEVVTNTAPNAAKIRGVNFSNYAYDAIPTGQTESVTFRIFNYSFVNAPAFTYDVYYQTKNSSTDLPDLSKAMQQEHVISNGTVPIIYGRSDEPDAPPNWHDAPFQWTTPSNAEQGYLHIVLHPAGQQLSTANDYGYIEVGIFDANQLLGGASGANALSANSLGANSLSANSLSARAIARENLETKGELTIESLKVTDEDGKELEDPLPLHKPFEVAVTVRLDGLEGSGLPAVLVNLYVNGSPVGSQHIPYLAGGDRRTITMTYDPRDHAGVVPSLENLTVRVFSAVTGFVRGGEEADPLSHVAERKFITFGGGGCDAGLAGGLAIFGALGAALLAWKKRK
jgi:hypothetical protein